MDWAAKSRARRAKNQADEYKRQLEVAQQQLETMHRAQTKERLLREQNPPLKDAWEKYKLLLTLVEGKSK